MSVPPTTRLPDVPVTAASFTATGSTISFTLNCPLPTGATLTVVNNTGLGFIQGTFDNLAQGQLVALAYGGVTYHFVANYFGGTGNDLVLQWANTRLVTWGDGSDGQAGIGGTVNNAMPVSVDQSGVLAGKTVISVVTGSAYDANSPSHVLALCSDGSIVSWGNNNYGTLGNGNKTDSAVPVLVDETGVLAGKTVVAIAAGYHHSLALCSDGTLATWGANGNGQLGNGGSNNKSSPGLVDQTGVLAGKKVVGIASGGNHCVALCSDGTLATWGDNDNGQLGNNGGADSPVPVLVDLADGSVLPPNSVRAVVAGDDECLAVYATGNGLALAAWGANGSGQLGNNSKTASPVPVAVDQTGVLAGKTVVSMGIAAHTLALCSDGTLADWGNNTQGQLGNGTLTSTQAPGLASVSPGSALLGRRVVSVAVGYYYSLALCSDGTVATWGADVDGQLGNGAFTQTNLPGLVSQGSLSADERFIGLSRGTKAHRQQVAIVAESPAVTGITGTAATLNGNVNVNGGSAAIAFDYGITTAYGTHVPVPGPPVTGATDTPVSVAATNLVPGTTYHFSVTTGSVQGMDLTFTTLRNDTRLSALATSTGAYAPAFDSGTLSYAEAVPNAITSLSLRPTTTDSAATVTVNGQTVASGSASNGIALKVGDNTIPVVVTAQDGTTTAVYTLTVTRAPSSNAALAGLAASAGGLAPAFDVNTLSYTVSTPTNVASTTITAVTADSTASLQVAVNHGTWMSMASGAASPSLPLNEGGNTVDVQVTAQDGTTLKTYELTVNRAYNASLASLTTSAARLIPAFASGTTGYTAYVSNATTSVTVTPATADTGATVEAQANGGGFTGVAGGVSSPLPVSVGSNAVDVKVTALDGVTTKTYTLTIVRAGAADATRPAVTIGFPAAAAKVAESVPTGMITITGAASDNKGVSLVEVQLNGGTFAEAALTFAPSHLTATYSLAVSPVPGINTLVVRSTDTSGNVSSLVTRSFTYVVLRPLSLTATPAAEGIVTISPALVAGKAQAGLAYTVTATAKTGSLFDFWDAPGIAGATVAGPRLTFVMTEGDAGATITAHFLANPFLAVAGTYNGLILPQAGSPTSAATAGFFTATVAGASGAFSCKLTIDGATVPLTGSFNPHTGLVAIGGATSNFAYAFTLDLTSPASGGTAKITGTLTQSNAGVLQSISLIDADLAVFSATHHAPASVLAAGTAAKSGVFTLAMPARDLQPGLTAAQYPQGSGTGIVTVTTAGVASFSGTLADGTAVTASAPLSKNLHWPLFALISGRLGLLAGQVVFDATLADSDLTAPGTLWIKPYSHTQYYPWGWDNGILLDVTGARYTAPAGAAAIPGLPPSASPAGNATLSFSQGGLSSSLVKNVNISTASKVTPAVIPDTTFAIAINAATGVMSGTFASPTLPAVATKFSGVILQKGLKKGGYGFFLTPAPANIDGNGQSGDVSLTAK